MADTILIVDDNESARRVTAHVLERHGFQVLTADDGPRALELVATHAPACILLDIMMPQMNGLEVLARLKENPATAAIPVILLTAKSQDQDVLTGYKEGAEYYITKPCLTHELLYGINLVLGRDTDLSSSERDDSR